MHGKPAKVEKTAKDIVNDYKSAFGFKNVGEVVGYTTIGGSGSEGTVTPTKKDFDEYLSVFGNYGSKAADTIVTKVARDMSGRGFKVRKSEDGRILETDNGNFKPTYNKKEFKWEFKETNSGGYKRETSNVANTLLKSWGKAK